MNNEKKLLAILIFTLSLMLVEFVGGIVAKSLSLVADAGHMLTDSLAIFLSYFAILVAKKPANKKQTFGYHRIEILVALINGLFLMFVGGYIFYEAINRFFNPLEINSKLLLIIGLVGFVGNLVGVLWLHSDSKKNLNIRGAFLHMLSDAMSSIGVIIGGVVVSYTKWFWIDSLIGVLIAGLVLRGAIGLIFDSGEILLESTPKDIVIDVLQKEVEKIPNVKGFHDIHIWTISTNKRALSAHVLVNNISIQESQKILCAIKDILSKKFNINHSTLEVECVECKKDACEYKNGLG
ncbi:MAG: cation diffusion facilitator family transporter [Endomicrobiia bacterium]